MQTLFLYNDSLLPFLFPRYRVETDWNAAADYVIMVLKSTRIPVFSGDFPHMICRLPILTATCDIKINDRNAVLVFLSNKLNLKVTKLIQNYVVKLTDEDFILFVKMTAVNRKWYRVEVDDNTRIYQLFEGLLESKKKFLTLYFALTTHINYQEVWSSVLTFLNRLDLFEAQKDTLSDYYRTLIFNSRKHFASYRVKLFPLLKFKRLTEVHLLSAMLDLK